MPCNTIQTATVEIGRVNLDLLKAAMEAVGYRASEWTYADGQITVSGRFLDTEKLALIKRQYSKQVVVSQAKRYGWQLKETGPYKYQVVRRV